MHNDPITVPRALRGERSVDPVLELMSPERSSISPGARRFEQMLACLTDIDAISFGNNDIAQGGFMATAHLKVDVPERSAVAGFNDLSGSDQMVPPPTTVRTPRGEVVRAGLRWCCS